MNFSFVSANTLAQIPRIVFTIPSLIVDMKKLLTTLILLLGISSLNSAHSQSNPPSHEAFGQILKKYVNEQGLVDYSGLKKDRASLKAYLAILEKNTPDGAWPKNEQLVYWINAYNAYTLDLVLEYYPLQSIKDITDKVSGTGASSPWEIKFINIRGKMISLDNIEHGIIRNQFNDPRIHYVLNCAAVSCAKLLREAYTADKIEEQLTAAARDFINDASKNTIENKYYAELSRIFSWYEKDFNRKNSLVDYINQYANVKLSEDAKISFKEYDWALNDKK